MKLMQNPYRDHFKEYGCKFYRHRSCFSGKLNREEEHLLNHFGLPDAGLPFFFFDFFLSDLRDIYIEDSKFILGTCLEMAGYDYLYVAKDHSIKLRLRDSNTLFVNSSLRQLMESIYIYSVWLEELEEKALDQLVFQIGAEEIFDLYYELRTTDYKALEHQNGLWPQIINTEMNIEAEVLKG